MRKAILATVVAGLGGFLGTCLRFIGEHYGNGMPFPIGTFIPNIVGCFLIGLFYGWATRTKTLSPMMNVFLITGLCGGMTTFSSLSLELVQRLQEGNCLMFWVYMLTTIIVGYVCVVAGIACVKKPVQSSTAASAAAQTKA